MSEDLFVNIIMKPLCYFWWTWTTFTLQCSPKNLDTSSVFPSFSTQKVTHTLTTPSCMTKNTSILKSAANFSFSQLPEKIQSEEKLHIFTSYIARNHVNLLLNLFFKNRSTVVTGNTRETNKPGVVTLHFLFGQLKRSHPKKKDIHQWWCKKVVDAS